MICVWFSLWWAKVLQLLFCIYSLKAMCSDIRQVSCSVEFAMWRFATSCWVCLSKPFVIGTFLCSILFCWQTRQDHLKKLRHVLPHSNWTNLLPLENNVSFCTMALWQSFIKQMYRRIVAVHSVPRSAPYLSMWTWACGMTKSHARSDLMYASLKSVWTCVVG